MKILGLWHLTLSFPGREETSSKTIFFLEYPLQGRPSDLPD